MKKTDANPYRMAYTPPWLTNTDIVAPCMCGEDLIDGDPFMLAESQFGLRRWWHPECFQRYASPDPFEDE